MSVMVNGMFGVRMTYNAEAISAIKEIPGRKWDSVNKAWWFPGPEIYTVANTIRPFFPAISDRLEKSPRFAEVRELVAEKQTIITDSFAEDADITIPCGTGLSFMGYQKAGVKFTYNLWKKKKHGVFIADAMGLGKTIQALGFINYIRQETTHAPKVLVVCPASLKNNWRREAMKWVVPRMSAVIMESSMPPMAIAHHSLVIVNYDILNKFFNELYAQNWDLIIFDESQYIKNKGAQRSKAARIISTKAKFVMLLTGTPVLNRPEEIWHQLHCIDPVKWSSFTAFANRYCGAHMGRYGRDTSGAAHLDELQRILRSSCMVRRMKEDVLKELPPKRRQVVEISKHGFEAILAKEAAVRNKYADIIAKMDNTLERDNAVRNTEKRAADEYIQTVAALKNTHAAAFSEIARIRHETALAKIPSCIKFIKDTLESKDKLIVFAHHRDVIEGIAKAFAGESVILYGGMNTAAKDAAVQAFKKNSRIKLIVMSIMAGGVGLTLTETDTVIFTELSWTPAENEQAEDRAHRIGQKDVVFVYHIVLEDSLDAYIAKRCIEKQGIINQIVNKVE